MAQALVPAGPTLMSAPVRDRTRVEGAEMDLKLTRSKPSEVEADAVVVLVAEGSPPPELDKLIGALCASGERVTLTVG